MADPNRIVFPDKLAKAKAEAVAAAAAADKTSGVDTNTVDAMPKKAISMCNTIITPGKCPDGFIMCPDGKCRKVDRS